MPLTCQQLLQKHPQLWREATIHPFLQQCKTGEIKPSRFNTWLVQDYLFVVDFTRLAARLLSASPVEYFDTLLGGLGALKAELNWFRDKAQERGLDLSKAKQPTCETYCQFMAGLPEQPYAIQATAFWAIEYAYNQGWQLPGAMTPPYDEFADRWGNTGFTAYVQLLAQAADQALQTAPDAVQQQAEDAFQTVAHLEKEFWQMAFEAEG